MNFTYNWIQFFRHKTLMTAHHKEDFLKMHEPNQIKANCIFFFKGPMNELLLQTATNLAS